MAKFLVPYPKAGSKPQSANSILVVVRSLGKPKTNYLLPVGDKAPGAWTPRGALNQLQSVCVCAKLFSIWWTASRQLPAELGVP